MYLTSVHTRGHASVYALIFPSFPFMMSPSLPPVLLFLPSSSPILFLPPLVLALTPPQQEAKLRSIANNSAGSSGTELRLPSIPNFIRGGIQPEPFGNDGKMNIHPELDFTWYDVMQLFR